MAEHDWRGLLTQWSRELIAAADADEELRGELTSEVAASGWLGFPPATEEQVAAVESRLGVALPPSYRAFLSATNGWRFPRPFISRLWSTEELDWLAAVDQEGIEAWRSGEEYIEQGPLLVPSVPDAEYFRYDADGVATGDMRSEYLQGALLISEREYNGTGVYLLNPRVVTPDGEWEAWFWAHWIPGAGRCRTFWDMLRHEYRTDIRLPRHKRQ
jgi:hypothetical protein